MTYTSKSTAFNHQSNEVNLHAHSSGRLILWEQGVGKTKAGIDTTGVLADQGRITGAFTIAPSGVHRNWVTDELPKHFGIPYQAAFFDSSKSSTKKHQAEMDAVIKGTPSRFPWLCMSYDGFRTTAGRQTLARFMRRHGTKLIGHGDELHHAKTPAAKRTISLVAAFKHASYKRGYTGTPIAVGPFDIYSQVRIAVSDDFWKSHGLPTFTDFKAHFGIWRKRSLASGDSFEELISYRNLEYLNHILAPVTTRETKESAGLNLPPKLYSKRYIEVTPEQRRLYTALRDEYMALLASGEVVTAALAITRLIRFQQVLSGFIPTSLSTLGEEPHHTLPGPNPRLEAMADWSKGVQHKGIIWARFDMDIDLILGRLREQGITAVQYDGRISEAQRAVNKDDFNNERGGPQFFVAKAQSGGSGLTLLPGRSVFYYNNTFKLIDRLQSEDRPHRIGQHWPVDYTDCVAAGTVDEHIHSNLKGKLDIASTITGDSLRDWL